MAYGVQAEDYQLGLHKIFMRSGKAAFLEELKDADIDTMVPIITQKIQQFEAKKKGKKVLERALLTWIWRRRIRKLKMLAEAAKKTKRVYGAKAGKSGKGRELATHEITEILADMSSIKTGGKATKVPIQSKRMARGKKPLAVQASPAAPPPTQAQMQSAGGAAVSGGSVQVMQLQQKVEEMQKMITAQQTNGVGGGGMLPQMAGMAYGPRVVTKRQPVDPNDKSAFTINVPQGAKSIIKQAVDEYKQTNTMSRDELELLEKFMQALGAAKPAETIFGTSQAMPTGANAAGAAAISHDPDDLVDELVDAPQMFEYDDIVFSGHLLMKAVELVPSKKKKKERKKDEYTLEYFILLKTKHIVHFQPNTGFVDPFTKSISGKAIDLMMSTVKMGEDGVGENLDSADEQLRTFEIHTARVVYQLKPRPDIASDIDAETWVEQITEVMLSDDHADDAGEGRDYGDFLEGYNEVKPEDAASTADQERNRIVL